VKERYEIEGFRFNRLFNMLAIVDSRVNDGYVEYRFIHQGRCNWIRRYKLVWQFYKKKKKKYGYHIHHKDCHKKNDRPSNLIQLTNDDHAAVHGVRYNTDGKEGGSKRNLGTGHSEDTREQMSDAMMGNKNSPVERSEQWGNRIQKAKARRGKSVQELLDRGITIRKVVKAYCIDKLSITSCAGKFGIGTQQVGTRLDWFMEDNCGGKISLTELRKNLSKITKRYYWDEWEHLEDTLEYKVIHMRFCSARMVKDVAKKFNIKEKKVDRIIKKFSKRNDLVGKYVYQVRDLMIENGMENFEFAKQ